MARGSQGSNRKSLGDSKSKNVGHAPSHSYGRVFGELQCSCQKLPFRMSVDRRPSLCPNCKTPLARNGYIQQTA